MPSDVGELFLPLPCGWMMLGMSKYLGTGLGIAGAVDLTDVADDLPKVIWRHAGIHPPSSWLQFRFLVECNVLFVFSFDEVYYGQYISFYMKRIFFLDDSGPPFGHMLLALGGRIH